MTFEPYTYCPCQDGRYLHAPGTCPARAAAGRAVFAGLGSAPEGFSWGPFLSGMFALGVIGAIGFAGIKILDR